MKLFECIIDTGESAIKERLTAKNKRELIENNSWFGEFVKVTDVTNDLFSEKTMTDIRVILGACEELTVNEINYIVALLDDNLNIP